MQSTYATPREGNLFVIISAVKCDDCTAVLSITTFYFFVYFVVVAVFVSLVLLTQAL